MAVTGAPTIGKLKRLYSCPDLSSPVWTEQGKVQGGNIDRNRDVAEIKERVIDETTVLVGHINTSYRLSLTRRVGDTFYNAIEDAFSNGTNINLAIMTGDITNSGERGYQAEFKVVSFPDDESHTNSVNEIELRPAADYGTAPAAVEIA